MISIKTKKGEIIFKDTFLNRYVIITKSQFSKEVVPYLNSIKKSELKTDTIRVKVHNDKGVTEYDEIPIKHLKSVVIYWNGNNSFISG